MASSYIGFLSISVDCLPAKVHASPRNRQVHHAAKLDSISLLRRFQGQLTYVDSTHNRVHLDRPQQIQCRVRRRDKMQRMKHEYYTWSLRKPRDPSFLFLVWLHATVCSLSSLKCIMSRAVRSWTDPRMLLEHTLIAQATFCTMIR